jgi:hypothetical protein
LPEAPSEPSPPSGGAFRLGSLWRLAAAISAFSCSSIFTASSRVMNALSPYFTGRVSGVSVATS